VICVYCPRYCKVDRKKGERGFCRAGPNPKVALWDLHLWEEPCISGTRGSGAVFFSRCNLECLFCQNHAISRHDRGREMQPEELCEVFLSLEKRGAHNINLVSPTHNSREIARAIEAAKEKGIGIPFVYNSNGYDSLETLEFMEGLIDVYLPDLKYWSDSLAMEYSSAPSYFKNAQKAILEMSRQVGTPVLDSQGIIMRGLIVRHLVLPGAISDSIQVLKWIKDNLPQGTYVSLMSQYYPTYRAKERPPLDRTLTQREYDRVLNEMIKLGLLDGYVQELSSATGDFTPDFDSGKPSELC